MATSAIVLPPLNTWAQQHLTALIQATTQADFDQAFDNFISKNVQVTFNGAPLTRDQYKQQFQGERVLESSATVTVSDVVQAPVLNTQATQNAGVVGLSYDATYFEKIIVFGAPAAHMAHSTLIIQVAQDESIPLPPAGIHGDVDRRRVVSVVQVLVDQQEQISLPTANNGSA